MTYSRPKFEKGNAGPVFLEWFKKRGISAETLKANGVDCINDIIRFPYFKGGQVVNVKSRPIKEKKFWQEKDAEKCLYRFDAIADGNGDLVICEGEIDALTCFEVGIFGVTSIPDGAPSETAKEYHTKFDFLNSAEKLLDCYRRIVLATDADGPGRKAEEELARRIGVERCWRVKYPAGCKDLNEVLVKCSREAVVKTLLDANPIPVEGIFSPSDLKNDLLNLYEHGMERGLSTGWATVDPFYTVARSEFNVITGIPGHGKSEFADALMVNLMRLHGWRVGVFSPENLPMELHLSKLVEKVTERPFYRDGYSGARATSAEVLEATQYLDSRLSFIYPESESLTIDNILQKARALVFRNGINGLVLDPWNEFEHRYEGHTEAQYLSAALSKIRRFARVNRVAVWLVAHPRVLNPARKDTEKLKPPNMYEISGGAHWFNKSDNGLCVYRENYSRDETTLLIQKIRFKHIGQRGQVVLNYCRETGIFTDKKSLTG